MLVLPLQLVLNSKDADQVHGRATIFWTQEKNNVAEKRSCDSYPHIHD